MSIRPALSGTVDGELFKQRFTAQVNDRGDRLVRMLSEWIIAGKLFASCSHNLDILTAARLSVIIVANSGPT